MKLTDIGEFGFIERFAPWFGDLLPAGYTGIGDDCALIPDGEDEYRLVTTDLLVENIHFLRDSLSPWQLGYKSLAVNLSDIAAMGAEPLGSFLSLAIPGELELEYLDEFMKGYLGLSQSFQTPLLGGDTTKSPEHLTVNVCVIGRCEKSRIKKRSMAREGDVICVTGELGDSAGGLKLILENVPRTEEHEFLLHKHFQPEPRLKEGRFLSSFPDVHAMIDISDGISSDLPHVLKASGKSARIDLDSIPVSGNLKKISAQQGWDPSILSLSGGEDYELLCTIAGEAFPRVEKEFLSRFGKALVRIGEVEEGDPSVHWVRKGKGVRISARGFNHFQ